jgi:hypothetical protein
VHVRCASRPIVARSLDLDLETREILKRSEQLQARSQRLRASLDRRLPCPICGETLATMEAVLFLSDRLVHAKCWPGDEAPARICGKCAKPLMRYEPAAFEGRTAYHMRCWKTRPEEGPSTSG